MWDNDFPVSIHHGSLAKPSRLAAEKGLKNGELKGLIATSSLELGIDVGRIDLVIQYMSPRQVTRLIQRVGRAGHTYGHASQGVIICMDSDDTLEALVIARRALREELEPVEIPPKPFDALAHQIAGLLLKTRRLDFAEILTLAKNAYPYADLTMADVEKILKYMHGRFPRLAWVSFEDKVVLKPSRSEALFEYYFDNLSMIPEEKQFLVIDQTTDSSVGVLDEAFMADYGKVGTAPGKLRRSPKTKSTCTQSTTPAAPSQAGLAKKSPFPTRSHRNWRKSAAWSRSGSKRGCP
jgi:ATP-dependent Lhr-like helicase